MHFVSPIKLKDLTKYYKLVLNNKLVHARFEVLVFSSSFVPCKQSKRL